MEHSQMRGLTLMELVVVMVIIGITATLAMPEFFRSREKAVNKHGFATLELIRAAERTYWVEHNETYFPSSITGTVTNVDAINSNLSLYIIDDGKWGYKISPTATKGFRAELERTGYGYDRRLFINSTMYNATCEPLGAGGKCP